MRQNACVQHVRIREHHVALFTDGPASIRERVAVISKNSEAVIETLVEIVKLRQLVLRQSFGGEKIQRASVYVFQDRIQDWQVVAKRFSGSRWSDHNHVLTCVDSFGSDGLMRVKLSNTLGAIRSD